METLKPSAARRRSQRWLLILFALGVAGSASGQVYLDLDLEVVAGPPALEFSLSNPGARSMGFGGAFVALADDATAALVNPAGLVQLVRPEFSAEGSQVAYSTPYTKGGRVWGPPSGNGIDTESGPISAEDHSRVTALSFLSYVLPHDRWAVALYRHQAANFETTNATDAIFGCQGQPPNCLLRYPDQLTHINLDILSHGVSVGYRISETFSIGLGLSIMLGKLRMSVATYLPECCLENPEIPAASCYGPSSYNPEMEAFNVSLETSGSDIGLNAGWLWKPARNWRVGGAFRRGPEFKITQSGQSGPADPPAGRALGSEAARIRFPDAFGLGLAYQSEAGDLTVSLEWDRVEYATIVRFLDQQPGYDMAGYELENADELHLGAEYVFLRASPVLAVRIGMWHDPDHRTLYKGDDPYKRAILNPDFGYDVMHYAIGLGAAWKNLQIDIGIDHSDFADTASLSAIYSF